MTDRQISIGILGSGGYGGTAQEYLNNTGEFKIVACMDIDSGTAQSAASKENALPYTDVDDFLKHPEMEAVCINTPIWLHEEHSIKSLEAGKHVFITKPVTAFVEEVQKIAATAKNKQLAYMVGHHARLSPTVRLASEIIKDGKLGCVCNVVATCCSGSALEQKCGAWRLKDGVNPGGPLLQCGIHTIDILLGLFGPATRVSAMKQDDVTDNNTTDNIISLIQFKSGVQVVLIANYTTAYMHTLDFFGTKANLHAYKHITGLGQEEVYLQPRGKGLHEPWSALRIPYDNSYPDDHGGILEKAFAAQIRSGKPDYSNLAEAIDALKLLHAAVESCNTGKCVDL